MKKNIIFLFLINIFFLNAQEKESLSGKIFYNYGGEITWEFLDDSILEISEYTEQNGLVSKKIDYTYQKVGPYYHLILKEDSKEIKYVVLPGVYDEFFLLYEDKNVKPIHNGLFGRNSIFYANKTKYITDNYLTEGLIKYIPENLGDLSIGKPWVEGETDSGIGKYIKIENSRLFNYLVISNGFVSYKPSTYYNNNRLKKIRIINKENEVQQVEILLQDTAIPAEIELPFETKRIDIEILEVYKGEKYDDTCINFILCKSYY